MAHNRSRTTVSNATNAKWRYYHNLINSVGFCRQRKKRREHIIIRWWQRPNGNAKLDLEIKLVLSLHLQCEYNSPLDTCYLIRRYSLGIRTFFYTPTSFAFSCRLLWELFEKNLMWPAYNLYRILVYTFGSSMLSHKAFLFLERIVMMCLLSW